MVLNEKFSEDPKKYFEKKLMTAIFRKVWSKVSMQLDGLVNMHTGKTFKKSSWNWFQPKKNRQYDFTEKISKKK